MRNKVFLPKKEKEKYLKLRRVGNFLLFACQFTSYLKDAFRHFNMSIMKVSGHLGECIHSPDLEIIPMAPILV